jgi:hypothetical protein
VCCLTIPVSVLTLYLSYSAKNLLIPIVLPGPHEQTADQLQNYLKIIVDDLLKLFHEGIYIRTPRFPQGEFFVYCFCLVILTLVP